MAVLQMIIKYHLCSSTSDAITKIKAISLFQWGKSILTFEKMELSFPSVTKYKVKVKQFYNPFILLYKWHFLN